MDAQPVAGRGPAPSLAGFVPQGPGKALDRRSGVPVGPGRRGALPVALSEIRQAVRRDPGNWRYRYDLALFTAASGSDAASAARAADVLNPLEPFAFSAPRVLVGTGAEGLARGLIRTSR